MKTNRKSIILDICYLLISLILFLVYYFSGQSIQFNNFLLVVALFLIYFSLFLLFGPFFGKAINSFLFPVLFIYLTSSKINLFSILFFLVGCYFVYLYFKNKKNYYHLKFKFKIISLFSLYLAYFCSCQYVKKIDNQADSICINLTYSDYYYYYHSYNANDFINHFGKLSYLDKKIRDVVDNYIFKDEYQNIIDNYANRDCSVVTNNYSGLFKDKNLIIIQANCLFNSLINESTTPNITALKNQSLQVVGFDSPLTVHGINDAEFMINLSLYPNRQNGCVTYTHDENYYGETLASLFNRGGYISLMFTNDYEIYYNHERIYKTYGYYDLVSPFDLGLDGYQTNSTILSYFPEFISQNDKTLIYYSMLENLNIEESTLNELRSKYPSAIDQDIIKIANLIELDEAIGNLQKNLIEANLDKNTVIILVGYNDDFTEGIVQLSNDLGVSSNTILYFYDGINSGEYYKCGSLLDFIPTLANLFNLEYKKTYIIGEDIFNDYYLGAQLTDYYEYKSFWYSNDVCYNYALSMSNDYWSESGIMKMKMNFSKYWIKYSNYYLSN